MKHLPKPVRSTKGRITPERSMLLRVGVVARIVLSPLRLSCHFHHLIVLGRPEASQGISEKGLQKGCRKERISDLQIGSSKAGG